MRQFGLIGYPLGHSFSKKYFTEKFERERVVNVAYDLYPLAQIEQIQDLLQAQPALCGLNVTIPYKEAVIPYLDELDTSAQDVGAVNCIRIDRGLLKGFNTDIDGFDGSLRTFWLQWPTGKSALILGTGGASKAVATALRRRSIPFQFVSRNAEGPDQITYKTLQVNAERILQEVALIINTTPLGMAPAIETCPELPFEHFGPQYFIYDLVYNPAETLLLRRAAAMGCQVKNGLEMLQIQAEKAWEIWNADESIPDKRSPK